MLKNRIHALLSQQAVERPAVSDLYGRAGLAWLHQLLLPEPDGQIRRADVGMVDDLTQRIGTTETLLRQLAAGDEAVPWLASLPGLGAFLAVLIRYAVDDITRFRTPKHFASYTGLVPSTYASGARQVHGRLTKQGNKWLRWAWIEAVQPAVRGSPCLRRFYEQLQRRRGAKDARTATARKLADLVWTVWTERRCWQEQARPPQSSQTPVALVTSWA